MTAVSVVSFITAVGWVNKPFAGIMVYKFPRVGSYNYQDWPCVAAGCKVMDPILSVNGLPSQNGREIIKIVNSQRIGTLIRYTIVSHGKPRQVDLPVSLFRWIDFFMVFIVPLLGGLAFFTIGLIVFILKPHTHISWVFFLCSFVVSFYIITGFDIQSSYYFVNLHYFMIPIMPATLFHLGSVFPEKKLILRKHPSWEYFVYIPGLLIAVAYQLYLFTFEISRSTSLKWIPDIQGITNLNRIFSLLCVAGMLAFILHSMVKTPNSIGRKRAGMILIGLTIAFLPSVIIMLWAIYFRINFPWNFLVFFGIFFPAFIAYSIIRHNLFDADALIKRTVGYAIVTIILIGAYSLTSLGLNFFLGQYQIAQSKIFPIMFTLFFILIINPLRNRIQDLVDRLFFRKEYDPKQIIDRLGTAMTSLMDLPQILRQLVTTFSQELFIDNSAILLLNPSSATYRVHLSEGENHSQIEAVSLQRTEALSQIIETEKKEITRYDVQEDPKYKNLCLDCAQNFSTLFASLIVPMILRDEVIGFISLGEKKSGKFYNREDINLLRTLASQAAVAIENARMAEEMKNEELVRANLARYLSPQIVEQVIKQDVKVNLGGARKEVTVLFSDIRNFTSISESMKPEQLVEFLNEYFTEMAQIIFKHQGSLDKYIGDAIVAVFGSLIPLENPAEAAVKASIEMMQEMARLNERWKDRYGFNMEMGIGINTGEVFLGNIGSPERMEFTVIGDTVNTASRFSSIAKGRQILATRTAKDHLGPEIQINQLPTTKVKGKAEEVDVFEVIY
jgi:adenylate cyclase